ncbi:MAG TPA: lipopolysaccharide heptosyltransferase II [Dehalococcoidia bacterium]
MTAWERAERVLCVRLDAVGDVLMTTPAIRAVRESRPGRRVTLLTSPAGAEAAALVPEIDEVLVYEAPWMKAARPRPAAADLATVERLRAAAFDAAVIFTVYSQSPLPAAFLCHLAGIPLRLAHCRENPYLLLTDWVPEAEPERLIRHEVQRQLDLVAAVGCRTMDRRLSLQVPETARRRAERLLAEAGVDRKRPWVVVHPGASAPSRRYPAESFAAAARHLALEAGWQVVLTGGRGEVGLVEAVRAMAGVPSASLAGQMTLADLAAVIALAPLVITNNTGPAHMAAALGTPVVDLYALTNPQHTPWLVPHRALFHDVPCRNCYKSVCPEGHHNCLRLVPPESVVEAALALSRETAGRTGVAP